MQPIHLHFDSGCGEQQYSRILNLLTNLNERQERLMNLVQLTNQKLDQLKAALDGMKERVLTDIDYLKTRLNSGEQVSVGDLEALEAKFNRFISEVNDFDPIPEIPTPEVPAVQAQTVADQGSGITNDSIPEATQTQLTEGSNEPVIIPTS